MGKVTCRCGIPMAFLRIYDLKMEAFPHQNWDDCLNDGGALVHPSELGCTI